MWTGLTVFLLTYAVVSARRLGWLNLDRPGGALLGAVAVVLLGVLPADDAVRAIDGRTLLLLFGMMGMGAFLGADGFFERTSEALAGWAQTPARLLGAVIWGAGGLSALITNDAVCVLGAPILVALIKKHRLPPLPFLLGLATASNTGSVATLVGNPQNMLCASLGQLSYREHLILMLPLALISLALNHALLHFMHRSALSASALAPTTKTPVLTMQSAATLFVIFGTSILYTLGADLAWTAAGGCGVLLLLTREKPEMIWARIDWSVLLFFAALFVVVEGLVRTGAPELFFARHSLGELASVPDGVSVAALFLVGSNVVSNVPFILVVKEQMAGFSDPKLAWEMLAMASTFAGNLTLLGSVANVIVAEKSHEVGGFGFFAHLRVGLPLALATTLLGSVWLMLIR